MSMTVGVRTPTVTLVATDTRVTRTSLDGGGRSAVDSGGKLFRCSGGWIVGTGCVFTLFTLYRRIRLFDVGTGSGDRLQEHLEAAAEASRRTGQAAGATRVFASSVSEDGRAHLALVQTGAPVREGGDVVVSFPPELGGPKRAAIQERLQGSLVEELVAAPACWPTAVRATARFFARAAELVEEQAGGHLSSISGDVEMGLLLAGKKWEGPEPVFAHLRGDAKSVAQWGREDAHESLRRLQDSWVGGGLDTLRVGDRLEAQRGDLVQLLVLPYDANDNEGPEFRDEELFEEEPEVDVDPTVGEASVSFVVSSTLGGVGVGHLEYWEEGDSAWSSDLDGDSSDEYLETRTVARPAAADGPTWIRFRAVVNGKPTEAQHFVVPAQVEASPATISISSYTVTKDGSGDTDHAFTWVASAGVTDADHQVEARIYQEDGTEITSGSRPVEGSPQTNQSDTFTETGDDNVIERYMLELRLIDDVSSDVLHQQSTFAWSSGAGT